MTTEVGQLGQRLIPSLVEYRAQTEPHHIWAYVARSAQVSVDGFREVTFQDLANAINRAAWWLEDRLGKPSDFETIAYLGPSDIRYYIFLIASVKVGYRVE
jgi:acyl-CoA synthetase (AMP-forming)/AMP-acid ligase II